MHLWSLKDLHKVYNKFAKVLFISAFLSAYFILGVYQHLTIPTALPEETIFKVRRGQTLSQIIEELKTNRVISTSFWIKVYLSFKGLGRSLKQGDYLIPARATPLKILRILLKGHGVVYNMTIPEGLTNHQVLEFLEHFPFLEEDIVNLPPEGLLFPDTYKVQGGVSYETVIEFMHEKMIDVLATVWAKRDKGLYLKTPEEMLIVASLIEKETSIPAEMPRIAGVFINRLLKKMRLQSDPTTIYGLTEGKGKLGRSLKREDMGHAGDFNTYHIKGLPPTPICNPGLRALEAAAHPEKNNFIYFVANGVGGHTFSVTYEDHKAHIKTLKRLLLVKNNKKA